MTMVKDDPDAYPEADVAHHAIEFGKGLAGFAFPGAVALGALVESEHDRRLKKLHRRTGERLRLLEQGVASCLLQRASEGDQDARDEILSTYSMIVRLVQEAMDEGKREALAAAMASTLQWPADGEDMERRYFLRCLSDFEAIHIELIARARGGVAQARELVNSPGSVGETAKAALKELNDRGMVEMDSVAGIMTGSGMIADRTTPQGKRFLEFIGRVE